MKLWVLMENTACREDLAAEHGLSLYLETGEHRILFDMGASGAFWDNAEKMGIDLTTVDIAVLSHGHYDHGGGLSRFLAGNRQAEVYVNEHAFGGYYNAKDSYIGLDQALRDHPRLTFAGDRREIAPGLTLFTCSHWEQFTGMDCAGLQRMEKGLLVKEDFRHEQYLLIEEQGKKILISGCSHKGILNIAQWFRPEVLIGGFHFMKMDPDGEAVAEAAKTLMTWPTVYYTGHCTGQEQFNRMKPIMGDQLMGISAGSQCEI